MDVYRKLWIYITALLITLCSEHCARSENILAYFPFPAKSHHKVYQPIIEELASRGHRITYVTPFPLENPSPNVTIISTEGILQGGLKNSGIFVRKSPSFFNQMLVVERTIRRTIFEQTVKIDKVRTLINSKNDFDVILHGLFLQEHAAAFQYKFNAPGIAIFSFGDYSWVNELAGCPDNAAYMMNYHRPVSENMNFVERIINFLTLKVSTLWTYYELYNMQRDIDIVFNFTDVKMNRPNIIELISDQALILSHSHLAVSYPFPKAPHFKQIGGIAIPKVKPLPQDLQKFIDDSEDGFIYFSLGSVITASTLLTTEERDAFANAFAGMKERVLWKWEAGEWPGMPTNIMVAPWFPQADILAHEKCKVFITQGGLLSLFETVHFEVPVVVMPIFGDQPKNAKFITMAPIGLRLDLESITQNSVTWAVKGAMNNKIFKKEVSRRSALLKDSPNPKDEAIRWIEYVLKHGRALQPKGAQLSYFKLHLLDVTAFFVAVLVIGVALIIQVTKRSSSVVYCLVLNCINRSKKNQ